MNKIVLLGYIRVESLPLRRVCLKKNKSFVDLDEYIEEKAKLSD
jgi:hypothetical protein